MLSLSKPDFLRAYSYNSVVPPACPAHTAPLLSPSLLRDLPAKPRCTLEIKVCQDFALTYTLTKQQNTMLPLSKSCKSLSVLQVFPHHVSYPQQTFLLSVRLRPGCPYISVFRNICGSTSLFCHLWPVMDTKIHRRRLLMSEKISSSTFHCLYSSFC